MKRKTYRHNVRPAIPANRSRSHLYHRTQSQAQLRMPSVPLRPTLAVIGFIVIVWALFFSPFFRVTTVNINGLQIIPKSQVAEKVSQLSAGRSLLILPRNTEWLFPASQTESQLKKDFPSFSKIKVSHHFPHTVTIDITEQPISLVWQTGGQQYLIDQRGVVSGKLPPGYKTKLVVSDTANLSVSVGKQILSPDFINFMQTVYTQLPGTVHTKVAQASVAETTLEVTVTTAQGYAIYFDTTRSAEKQLGYLKEIVDQVTAQHQTLAYVDLRADDRIFYKTQ
jgi:cell division septal protein FtsQ